MLTTIWESKAGISQRDRNSRDRGYWGAEKADGRRCLETSFMVYVYEKQ